MNNIKNQAEHHNKIKAAITSTAKGIEQDTLALMSDVIGET